MSWSMNLWSGDMEVYSTFIGYGMGELSDAIAAEVTEERNGMYELYLEYPVSGWLADKLAVGMIISAPVSDGNAVRDCQPFRIYQMVRKMEGTMEVYAAHLSYQLNHVVTKGGTASSAYEALNVVLGSLYPEVFFYADSDVTTAGAFRQTKPSAARSALMGQEGSILDVFGGEYEFDHNQVILHAARGQDRGVSVRYGKNMTQLEETVNSEAILSGVAPFWANDETGQTVTLPEVAVWDSRAPDFPYTPVIALDLSGELESAPTEAQLRVSAQNYLARNARMSPANSTEVEFIPLNGTDGGTILAPENETIRLCDIVTVEHEGLGISYKAKVVRTVWDCLRGRYSSITVGTQQQELSDTIAQLETAEDSGDKRYLPISGGTVFGDLNVAGAVSAAGITVTGTVTAANIPSSLRPSSAYTLGNSRTVTFRFEGDIGVLFIMRNTTKLVYLFDYWSYNVSPSAGSTPSGLTLTKGAYARTVTITNGTGSAVGLFGLNGTFS